MPAKFHEPLVVALDIGTSSVRAIAFDKVGAPIYEAQIKYSQKTTSDGGVETDAETLVSNSVACLTALLKKAGAYQDEIAGVGISCFWHSLVGIDSDSKAITPVFSWADTRSAGYVSKLKETFQADSYHTSTGCELHPCFWPAKLLWLQSAHPEIVRKTVRWIGFGEYLLNRLFGNDQSSLSMASGTGLFNQGTVDWDDNVLESLNISRSVLPKISGYMPVSGLRQPYRQKLSVLSTIPWFPAVGDGACSNIGSGGHDDSRLVLNVGTSAAIRLVAPSPTKSNLTISKGLFCYRVDETSVVQGGAFANGGNVYAWLKDQLNWADDVIFAKSVSRTKPDSHGLTVLPFWAGERSPGWHSDARASIIGMNLHTTRSDIVRASLEACAYSFDVVRLKLIERFPLARELVISGGAIANDPLFAQIVCDVFGTPLNTSRVSEASSLGAAMLAFRGLGVIKKLSDIAISRGRTFRPNLDNHAIYKGGSSRYADYYERLIDKK